MSTVHETQPTISPTPRRHLWALGGIGFSSLYFGSQFATAPLRVGSIPMPDAPTSEVVTYFSANSASSAVLGGFHILAAVSLLFLVGRVALDLRAGLGSRIGVIAGYAAVVTLVISGIGSIALAMLTDSSGPETVALLREINFRAGGVAHTVALGLFVGLWCLNSEAMGRGLRITGKILAVPAVLSIASVLWFYASALLPLGRYTLLVWLVFAAVSLLRRPRTTSA